MGVEGRGYSNEIPGHFLAKSDHSEPAAAQLAASIELQQSSVAKATLKGN